MSMVRRCSQDYSSSFLQMPRKYRKNREKCVTVQDLLMSWERAVFGGVERLRMRD